MIWCGSNARRQGRTFVSDADLSMRDGGSSICGVVRIRVIRSMNGRAGRAVGDILSVIVVVESLGGSFARRCRLRKPSVELSRNCRR